MNEFIPRSRLNQVIQQRNTYKEQLEQIQKELKIAQEKLMLEEDSLTYLMKIHHLLGCMIQKKMIKNL
ncbi:hypothetical protein [Marinisporobacter balticus]|uniref:Uncharacterized protein n=1 Tax=Marinisporobacter balticus TaxID=2018667 RepID=A0A4R2KVQ3_9FIRM|nr:hypothetical protein [Marinisporobacter balticus]TCO78024.1 hypothetical protein EV214_105123 [Marinisporobacter balticus]